MQSRKNNKMHDYQDLINIFNDCFFQSHHTKLVKGADEPVYIPANHSQPYHAILFAHGYFSSALHECAHWFIASPTRRKLEDYGYWYVPDGRSLAQQKAFQLVEIKPQAIEWILSVATGYKFEFSLDNLSGKIADCEEFKKAIYLQVLIYMKQGLPERAKQYHQALSQFYQTTDHFVPERFKLV